MNQIVAGGFPISVLEERTHNPRESFEPEQLLGLAVSINEYGVLQPICVVPKSGASDRYIIVAHASGVGGLVSWRG